MTNCVEKLCTDIQVGDVAFLYSGYTCHFACVIQIDKERCYETLCCYFTCLLRTGKIHRFCVSIYESVRVLNV